MRKIYKSAEPRQWIEYKTTPGVAYESKPELKDSLLREQGYICAYCNRRIPTKDGNSNEVSRIDHIKSRSEYPEKELDYSNMAICCPGAIDSNFHCDKNKGERSITFELYTDRFFETLSYNSKDGLIESSNTTWNDEINKILNLNHKRLMYVRSEALEGVRLKLTSEDWKKSAIIKQLTNWENKDSEGKYKPDSGIVVWYLKKKLKQTERR